MPNFSERMIAFIFLQTWLLLAVIALPCSDRSKEQDLLKEARALYSANDIRKAEKCLEFCVKLYPKSFECWYQRGLRAQQEESHKFAVKMFRKAVELNPNSFRALQMLAGNLLLVGPHHARQAHTHLTKAAALNPNSAALLSVLALTTYHLGKVDDALELWQRCIKLDPHNEALHLHNMIGVYQESGRLGMARKLLSRMLILAPNSAEAHDSLAILQA